MTTRKRWTTEEETQLIKKVSEIRDIGKMPYEQIFEELSTWDEFKKKTRTPVALRRRYEDLLKFESVKVVQKEAPAYSGFLQAMENFTEDYQSKCIENERLRKRVAELEQQAKDYETVVKIMEQARKMIVNQELGEVEQVRLKMDQNGNMERIR